MLKQTLTILFILLFLPVFIYGQDIVIKEKKMVDDSTPANYKPAPQTSVPSNRGAAQFIGVTTDYDYFSNSVIRRQIVYDAGLGTPHLMNMVRPGLTGAHRDVVHSFHDGTNWVNQSLINAQSGWPHVDISLTGSAEGTVAGVFHTPSRLAIWDGSTGYLISQFDPSTDPSVQFVGDNIYLATSGDRTQFQFYVTTDFGVSFDNFDSISTWHPTPIWWVANGGVEVGMAKSPNEMYFAYFGTNEGQTGGGAHVYSGANPNEADNFWAIFSNDAGSTFQGQMIAPDGQINLVSAYHTANYAPLFENFGQVDMAVGNNGVWHAVANGYGLVFDDPIGTTAIANSFPVLYWNSGTSQWVSISSEAVDTLQDIITYYPGNGLGQAYPSVAVSEDGQCVFVVWTGPQITGGQIDTANGLFMTDIYHTFSDDGGATWTYGGVLVGDVSISEAWANVAQHLRVEDGSYVADIVYMEDLSTGVNVFGEGDLTNNPLMYLAHPVKPTSIGGNTGSVVNSFELSQNYPNPFNPSTLIKFSVAERSSVTLKVFDVLGKEVATLVNGYKDAGSHEINFNASELSSGLYIYTLQAGSFSTSRKMMLLK